MQKSLLCRRRRCYLASDIRFAAAGVPTPCAATAALSNSDSELPMGQIAQQDSTPDSSIVPDDPPARSKLTLAP